VGQRRWRSLTSKIWKAIPKENYRGPNNKPRENPGKKNPHSKTI